MHTTVSSTCGLYFRAELFKAGLRELRVSTIFEFRFESISVLILFFHKLMIESSKITEKIIRENAFEHKKKKPGLSANRPSNNWALAYHYRVSSFSSPLELCQTPSPPPPLDSALTRVRQKLTAAGTWCTGKQIVPYIEHVLYKTALQAIFTRGTQLWLFFFVLNDSVALRYK